MRISEEEMEAARALASEMAKQGKEQWEAIGLLGWLGGSPSKLEALRLAFEEEAKKWGKADVRNAGS